MHIKIGRLVLGVAAFGLVAGCGNARTPDQYAADTQAVLASKSGAIKDCYEAELRKDKSTKGTVTVQFTVEPETGKLSNIKVEQAASPALGACVTAAVEGLALAPADSNQGVATFTWDFTPGPTPPAPPPQAAPGPAVPPPG
jgi:hypothetical protein